MMVSKTELRPPLLPLALATWAPPTTMYWLTSTATYALVLTFWMIGRHCLVTYNAVRRLKWFEKDNFDDKYLLHGQSVTKTLMLWGKRFEKFDAFPLLIFWSGDHVLWSSAMTCLTPCLHLIVASQPSPYISIATTYTPWNILDITWSWPR